MTKPINFEKFQKGELFSYFIYSEIYKKTENEVFKKLATDELKHYNIFKSITKKEIRLSLVDKLKLNLLLFLSYIFGHLFITKLMEKNEEKDIKAYKKILENIKDKKLKEKITLILEDEELHEKKLVNLIHDKRVENLDSIILGINDALVELTGSLVGMAGFLNNNLKVAFSGLIIGIAASLSMAASSYLSKKAGSENIKQALKSAFYTGFAYIFTVIVLVFPFFIFKNKYYALTLMFFTF